MTKYKALLRTVQRLSNYQKDGRIVRRLENHPAADPVGRNAVSRIPRSLPKSTSIVTALTVGSRKCYRQC